MKKPEDWTVEELVAYIYDYARDRLDFTHEEALVYCIENMQEPIDFEWCTSEEVRDLVEKMKR